MEGLAPAGNSPAAARASGSPYPATGLLALLGVAAITAVGLVVRLRYQGPGLLGDELFAFKEVSGRSFGGMIQQVRESVEVSPPLYFVLAWAADQLGSSPSLLRVPSLALGTALVPLGYALGCLAFGVRAGFLAAALIALSPFEIFYATEARPYATVAFFATLAIVVLLLACRSPRRWSAWWLAVSACAALTMYSHYTGVFVLAAGAAWALACHRDRAAPLLASVALAVALFLPWLLQVSSKGQLGVYGPFRPLDDLRTDIPRTLVGSPLTPVTELPGTIAAALFVLVVAGSAAAVAWAWWNGRRPMPRAALLVGLAALATPLGMALLAALTGFNLFSPRNLSASVPAAYVVIGALLAAVVAISRTRAAWLAATVALAAMAAGTVKMMDNAYQRPDFEAIAAFIDRSWKPGSEVVEITPNDATSNRPLDPFLASGRRPAFGTPEAYAGAFEQAARAGADVFVIYPNQAAIRELVVMPAGPTGSRYVAAGTRVEPGIAGGTAVTRFAPRR